MTSYSTSEDYCKNIFDTICDKDGFITKNDILDALDESGIVADDPRISKLIIKLSKFSRIDKINLETFLDFSSDCIGLIEKSIN